MRIITIFILSFVACVLANAQVSIKTMSQNGIVSYYLNAATFAKSENATEFEQALKKQFNEPTHIEYLPKKSLHIVQIGPIRNSAKAKQLQSKVNTWMDKRVPGATTNTDIPETTTINKPTNESKAQPTTNISKEEKIWNLKNADIRSVIDEISLITKKNFIVDPRVQGKITIVSGKPISDKALYQVFLSMLQISGYTAIESGNIVKILPSIEARSQTNNVVTSRAKIPDDEEMIVQIIPVEYVSADQLVPVIRPLLPASSNINAYNPSNMLILSGTASHIKQIARIIKQVDSSSTGGVDIVRLKNSLAMDVANTLKDLVKSNNAGGGGAGGNQQATIAVDDHSNAILLSGSKTERIRLRLLINQLDEGNAHNFHSNTKVVYLHYLRAQDLVPILAGVAQANFSGNVGTTIGTITTPALDSTNPASNIVNPAVSTEQPTATTPAAEPANQNATPQTSTTNTSTEGSTKPTVQIIAEPNTNSIILSAPPSLIRILSNVISKLDIRPAQLLIDALVAEIDEEDVKDLGIEWGSINQATLDSTTFQNGFAIFNSQTSLRQFQAQLSALARQKRANILSTPSVVVLDNRQAKILVGKQVSVAASSYPNNASGTTTASPYTTFDRVNVALHLYVRPQITSGNGINLQIDQGNDTLDTATTLTTNTTAQAVTPTFNISSIVTSVHVESGDVIVLGGLAQNSVGNDDNHLPILGDIPGLGKFFQHNITSREKKILMVFIKPIILGDEFQALSVSGQKYNPTRRTELDFIRREEYNKNDKHTVLPSLEMRPLPIPFTGGSVRRVQKVVPNYEK